MYLPRKCSCFLARSAAMLAGGTCPMLSSPTLLPVLDMATAGTDPGNI